MQACGVLYAGALKDNCRGLLVGSRTYGKGLIQSIYELHDASGLALTVRCAFLAPWISMLDASQPDADVAEVSCGCTHGWLMVNPAGDSCVCL